MAAIETSRTAGAGGIIGHTVEKIVNFVTAWNDARVTRRALSNLTDRELDDIGLTRGDVSRIGIYH